MIRKVILLFLIVISNIAFAQQDSLEFKERNNAINYAGLLKSDVGNVNLQGHYAMSNIGGAYQSLRPLEIKLYQNPFKESAYDLYRMSKDSLPYSPTYKFLRFHYKKTNKRSQNIEATHTQLFRDFSFGVFYHRISSQGFFQNESKEHTFLKAEVKLHPYQKKYESKLSYTHRKSLLLENGGLANDTVYNEDLESNERAIPVLLSDQAQNTQTFNLWMWENRIYLKKDSLVKSGVEAHTKIRSSNEKFQDRDPMFQPSVFYGAHISKPFYETVKDSTGNAIDSVNTSVLSQDIKLFYQNENWQLKGGFFIQRSRYLNNDFSTTYTEYGLNADYRWKNRISGQMEIRQRENESSILQGNIQYDLTDYLSASLAYKESYPSWFHTRYRSNFYEWNQKLKTTKRTDIILHYQPIRDLKVTGFFNSFNDFIFINSAKRPEQTSENQHILGLEANYIKENKRWVTKGMLRFQQVEGNYIRYPKFHGTLLGGVKFQWLGAAHFTAGFQLEYFSSYYANQFMPSTSQFYIQNDIKVGNYPMLDFFLTMKVESFTGYILYENLTRFVKKDGNYIAPHHVWKHQTFRFGIVWNFYDK